MNRRMIVYILGKMMGVEGLLMLLPAFVALLYGEAEGVWFLVVAAILGLVLLIAGRKAPQKKQIYSKEGLVIVGLAWVLWSLFGALPFVLSGCIPNYLDAVFETISGFTTTGSTILNDIEALPYCMLFWRSFTHWIGGMGVLVFVMMLTPLDDENAMPLMRAEVPGPESDKLVPKARHTARLLYGMYLGLTAVEVVFLLFGGMSIFDALVHAFGTAGTGGFSSHSASIGYFNSAYIDGVITVFMILFGVNFNLYFFLLMKEWKTVFKNEELRTYLGIVAASIAAVTINIYHLYGSIGSSLRYAAFQVASIMTTTGYCTADFELWPEFSKALLVALMFFGACAGSTGGGFKTSRVLILGKSIGQDIRKSLHPKAVTTVRVNGRKVSADTLHSVYVYTACYIFILVFSVLIVSLDNFDFTTSFTAVMATFNNIGPGLSAVGPVENFASFSPLSKIVLAADMLLGRLEIYPYLLLLSPTFWRRRF